jgi:hypothetical protein
MGAATEFRSPHRRDAPTYLSTVEDLITYLWTGIGFDLVPRSPLNSVLRGNLAARLGVFIPSIRQTIQEKREDVSIILKGAC